VMILPSLSEGFPFVILEALAMACPVVATAVNGVPEIIDQEHTGLLVPPRDAQALEAAIRNVLRHPDWAARMGQTGQREVFACFTVGRMVQETVRVFEEAIPTLRSLPTSAQQEAQKKAA
jgi:glycosyltransferase involved in cell wall biosynthesis